MYHHLKGQLIEINPAMAIVECYGVGYEVNITLHTFSSLQGAREVMLYTLPIFKEDSQVLFGFSERSERAVFEKLIAVSGVGGNTARVILSSLSANETLNAIAAENVSMLQSVKGIGAKTAQRIIIDLKDKVKSIAQPAEEGSNTALSSEAVSALEVLGYPARQTERVIHKILRENPSFSLEDLIKQALNKL